MKRRGKACLLCGRLLRALKALAFMLKPEITVAQVCNYLRDDNYVERNMPFIIILNFIRSPFYLQLYFKNTQDGKDQVLLSVW
jgi:hypothetical protein